MSTLVVFVDGRVGIGKSTFIDMLEYSLRKCVDWVYVIREPLDRDIVGGMIEDVGYQRILDFIMSRKDRMLVDLIERHGGYSKHDNSKRGIILVERSFLGDLAVRDMVFRMYDIKHRISYKYRNMFTSVLIRDEASKVNKLLEVDDGWDIDNEQSALIHLYDTADDPYVNELLRPTNAQVARVGYGIPMLSNVANLVKELIDKLDGDL